MSAKCRQHVVNMSATCRNVAHFGQKCVSEPTQISHRHKIFVSGISDNGKYKKSTYKLNYVGKLEKHTPKMIHWSPILQRLCPLSPWVEQWCAQPMAPRIPMVPREAPTVRFGCAMTGLPVWGAGKRRIEKQRDGPGLVLRWGSRRVVVCNRLRCQQRR
jgi:hypothetical protein